MVVALPVAEAVLLAPLGAEDGAEPVLHAEVLDARVGVLEIRVGGQVEAALRDQLRVVLRFLGLSVADGADWIRHHLRRAA